ncbi:MAG: hypothetical protein WAU77_12755 [Solirubrobacteraceae bacterium]
MRLDSANRSFLALMSHSMTRHSTYLPVGPSSPPRLSGAHLTGAENEVAERV